MKNMLNYLNVMKWRYASFVMASNALVFFKLYCDSHSIKYVAGIVVMLILSIMFTYSFSKDVNNWNNKRSKQ